MKQIIALSLAIILCLSLIVPSHAESDPIIVGTTITLGEYEQDNDVSNGPEPIKWIVLDIQDNKALILSKYLLDILGTG